MKPQEALARQIARYREMTCGERIAVALRLHELASEMARVGIRAQYPTADPGTVEHHLRQRRRLIYVS
ncbi:MAG TPA: hypothetical protein P5186_20905 [Candidatus Paceibacterota bacterium]|nr:hypothetical protein [Verrucomicrobiota bacterium]HRY50518.1 hypothetical protein [Candidatus Paceibacterota bacterium]HSA01656.1 hypothetical protein [Candidatus Paceibacterota bacterium]